jgi:splicing factor U2AF subunit
VRACGHVIEWDFASLVASGAEPLFTSFALRAVADRYDDRRAYDNRGRRDERPAYDNDAPRRRSPTPEGAVPLSQWKREKTLWDVAAPGCESMSATEAKGRNLFHAPGPNRQYGPQYVLGPDGLPAPLHPVPGMGPGFIPRINGGGPGMGPVGGMGAGGAGAGGLSNNVVRQRRRLYVGGVTYDCTADNMRALFNERLASIGTTTDETGTDPCVDVQISHEKSYAFVEVRRAHLHRACVAWLLSSPETR